MADTHDRRFPGALRQRTAARGQTSALREGGAYRAGSAGEGVWGCGFGRRTQRPYGVASRAARMAPGDIGSLVRRTPMAVEMALDRVASGAMMGISPTPRSP
jgi:hypothetical protein